MKWPSLTTKNKKYSFTKKNSLIALTPGLTPGYKVYLNGSPADGEDDNDDEDKTGDSTFVAKRFSRDLD